MLGIGQIGSAIGRIGSTAPVKGGGVALPPAPALDPSVTGLTLANTSKIRAAMARVRNNTGRGKILTVGDSTTATGGVSSGDSRGFSWPGVMSDALTAAGIPADKRSVAGMSGTGNASSYNSYNPNFRMRGSAGAASPTLGGAAFGLNSATGELAGIWAGETNAFRVVYTRSTSPGVFSWSVDGGTPVTVDRQDVAPSIGELIIDASNAPILATPGNHTLQIFHVSGFASFIIVEAMRTNANYLRVINAGWSASTAGNWNTGSGVDSPKSQITREAPDLTFINLGINDWRAGDVNGGFTINMQAIVNSALAGGGDVILMQSMPSTSSGGGENVSEARQAGYRSAIAALASSNGLPIIDLYAYYGSGNQALADGWLLADGIHQTVAGYARTGNLVSNTLRYIEQMAA